MLYIITFNVNTGHTGPLKIVQENPILKGHSHKNKNKISTNWTYGI